MRVEGVEGSGQKKLNPHRFRRWSYGGSSVEVTSLCICREFELYDDPGEANGEIDTRDGMTDRGFGAGGCRFRFNHRLNHDDLQMPCCLPQSLTSLQ